MTTLASPILSPLVGIEVGGTKLQIVLADDDCRIVDRQRLTADPGGGPAIRRQVETGLASLLAGRRPRALGIGFGGPVDRITGRIARSHQVGGWDDFPLRDWLSGLAGGAPVAVENDANTAALGEAVRGAGAGLDPVFYANFGSGVGGGLIVGGDIYHAAPPGEVEFGHLRLDRDGTTVEDRCSGWAVDRRIRSLVGTRPRSVLAGLIGTPDCEGGGGGEARHLPAALAAADPVARQVLAELADDLAFALSHVVHLLHPRVIVLGGGLSLVGEPLRSAVQDRLVGYVMEAFRPPPPVRLAGLGEDAVPVGALELARRIANM